MNPSEHLQAIGDAFGRMSDDEIAQIEQLLRHPLPDDYKAFLKTYGRCGIDGDGLISSLNNSERRYPVDIFYGADPEGGRAHSLLDNLRMAMIGGDPEGLLAIASDMMGDWFYLDLHRAEVFHNPYMRNTMDPVARSFSQFLERIEVQPIED